MGKRKSVIIIGAGIAGMGAGCYAQMNGYDTKIYEMHFIPGGSCTAWERQGYMFDPCIEWMWGSGPHTLSNQIWRELGALKGKKIKDFDVFNQVKGPDGRIVNFYTDPDRLEAHLKEISPQDKEPIEEFCKGLRAFLKMDFEPVFLAPFKLMRFTQKFKFMAPLYPYFKLLGDAQDIQMSKFVQRFKDPLLQEAFRYIFFVDIVFPLLPYYTNLASANKGNAGFPEGGSLGVALSIEKRYKELGGEIVYMKKITKVIVENDRAIGVKFADGEEEFADIVISACDGRTVIYDLLEGKYTGETIETLYKEHLKEPVIFNGAMNVFLGVNRDLSDEPHSITYLLTDAEVKKLPAAKDNSMAVQVRTNYSAEFAPTGKSVIFAWYLTDYDYWKNLYSDPQTYREEKKKTAEFVIEYLNKKYPGIKDQVEVIDVSSPVTLERYTGNYRGSLMAWKPFTKAEKLGEKFINGGMQLPGLKNFYLTGQWALMGGTIRAASLARYVIQFVCKDDRKDFVAHEC